MIIYALYNEQIFDNFYFLIQIFRQGDIIAIYYLGDLIYWIASYIAFVDNIDPILTLYSIRDNGGLSEGLTIAINEQITRLEFDFLNNIHSIVYSITKILLKNVTNSYLIAYFLLMSANFYLLIVFYLEGCIRDIAV